MKPHELSFEAVADRTRRRILERIRRGPVSVGEIAAELPISQPAVSQHLAVLRRARLVTGHREGRRHLYSLDRTGLIAIRAYLDGFWDDVLDAFAQTAQEEAHRDNVD